MAEVATIKVETAEAQTEEVEDVQQAEHEIQSEEIEAWRSALSDVSSKMTQVVESLQNQGQQSSELRALCETQGQMIRDLMTAKAESDRQLLETVRTLLTPPPVVVEQTPTEIPLVEPAVAVLPEAETRTRRFRGL